MIKRIGFYALLLLFSIKLTAQKAKHDPDQIRKDLNSRSKAVHIFDDWMRDPYITIGPDGFYYLTCTQYTDATENIKQRIYKSNDLVSWEAQDFYYSLQDATHYDDMVKAREERNKTGKPDKLKLWAPEMHFIKGRWVIVHTSNVGLGNVVVAPEGMGLKRPFMDWGASFGRQHDPSLFVDSDSSVWVTSKCAEFIKIKPDLSGFEGKPIRINPSNRKMGHEGTCIIKFENKYVLFGTAWSTDSLRKGTYNLYYCTADKLTGPYGERKFAGRFLGHGTPFKDKKGQWWCTAFYNANVPPLSREVLKTQDCSDNAYTINPQGLTLVPLEIKMVNGEVVIKALDLDYQNPGKEEVQKF
jgi:xylan 1,4-beta-xylosidase